MKRELNTSCQGRKEVSYLSADTIFLDSECIISKNHILQIGNEYFLISGVKTNVSCVKLIGITDNADYVFLSFQDIKTGEIKKIPHPLQNDLSDCCWFLVDVEFIVDFIIHQIQSKKLLGLK